MEIKFDLNNMFSSLISPPYGIDGKEIDALSDQLSKAHANISSMRKKGELVFLDMPYKEEFINQVDEIVKLKKGKFENFVNIGIGGSALGSIAVFNALSHPFHNLLESSRRNNAPRMFFPDNIDPDGIDGLFDVLDIKKTLINITSKSGGTVETISTFLILRQKIIDKVGIKAYKDHIIVTTSESQGELRQIAKEEGFSSLSIPNDLGGRYSVLSPAGLLCAALLGYSVKEFMDGAKIMDKKTSVQDVWKNPAYLYSALHYIADQKKGLNIFVIMPYSNALRTIADWYAQLVSESLGKVSGNGALVGPTPVKTLGATDQHSQLQLYVEGRRDKVVTFIAVDNFSASLTIPKAYEKYDSIGYLGGHTITELFDAERKATELSLAKNNRLNCTISLPQITPHTLGQLFYFFEVCTLFLGQLYNVNPLDQPGVEESKDYARAFMGKKGSENKKREIEKLSKKDSKYCF